MVQRYKRTPSELLGVHDEYTAYCLNEACAYIMSRIDSGEEIHIKKQYKTFSDLYKQYG